MSFIPWGIDDLFSGRQRTTRPYSVFACGTLPWRLYATPATRAQYLAALRDVLDTVWDAPTILLEIDRMQALLAPLGSDAGFPGRLDPIRAFVTNREAQLRAELAAGDPVWPYAAGEPSCRIDLGTITATLSTPAGARSACSMSARGSMSGTIAGVDVTTATVFDRAGVDAEGKGALQLLGRLPDGTLRGDLRDRLEPRRRRARHPRDRSAQRRRGDDVLRSRDRHRAGRRPAVARDADLDPGGDHAGRADRRHRDRSGDRAVARDHAAAVHRRLIARYGAAMSSDRPALVAAVVRALDDTEREYAQMPFFVRPMVRRGFEKRTGHDLAGWRALLARVGDRPAPELDRPLAALAEHYRGAPERARRGMGARPDELREVEARSTARAAAVEALRAAVVAA
jgi:hypothetical protein